MSGRVLDRGFIRDEDRDSSLVDGGNEAVFISLKKIPSVCDKALDPHFCPEI